MRPGSLAQAPVEMRKQAIIDDVVDFLAERNICEPTYIRFWCLAKLVLKLCSTEVDSDAQYRKQVNAMVFQIKKYIQDENLKEVGDRCKNSETHLRCLQPTINKFVSGANLTAGDVSRIFQRLSGARKPKKARVRKTPLSGAASSSCGPDMQVGHSGEDAKKPNMFDRLSKFQDLSTKELKFKVLAMEDDTVDLKCQIKELVQKKNETGEAERDAVGEACRQIL